MARIINKFGEVTGWNHITLNMLGRDVEGVNELEYNDDQEMENVYGAGAYPVGQGKGQYNATAGITLMIEEKRAIEASLPSGRRLQDVAPFDIKVSYDVDGTIYTDVIKNCRIKNNGVAVSQNDKTIATKHDLLCSHIEWNVK